LLLDLARSDEPALAREAIRTLARAGGGRSVAELTSLALDASRLPDSRAEALVALGWAHHENTVPLLKLLDDSNSVVRIEAVRLLSRNISDAAIRNAFVQRLQRVRMSQAEVGLAQRLDHALNPPGVEAPNRLFKRPESLADWQRELTTGGDPVQGGRVFFSAGVGCSGCHTINNRGAHIGPDLSNLGQSVRREQIVRSILRPSDEFAPQWQAWFVETKDGEVHQGLQLDHKAAGAIELFTTAGRTEHFKGGEIARYGVRQNSLMPDGLEAGLTVEDFRNLVAFLESTQ
jgi:putative heme-binding domain-containing protein